MSRANLPGRDDAATLGDNKVRRWQLDISQEKDAHGIIFQLYDASRDLYQAFMRDLRSKKHITKSLHRRLQSGYTQYVVWAGDYEVLNGSLDLRLEKSQRLRRFTIKLLMSICAILMKACSVHISKKLNAELPSLWQAASTATEEASRILHSTSTYPDTESDTSDEEEPDAEDGSFKNTIETLLNDIGHLIDLGPRLEEPVPDCPGGEQPGPKSSSKEQLAPPKPSELWNPVRYFVDRVLAKFPKCDSNLASALGQANWDSLRRLHEKREATKHRSKESIEDKVTIFQDSGLGTSLPTTDPYAATITSYVEGGVTRTKIPPLPSDVKKGQMFPCIACGRNIKKQDMRTWKRHLLADLQPWVCCQTSCPCSHTPFATRKEWIEHLRKGHSTHPEWDDKTCPICTDVVPGGLVAISHVAHHLEEISLAALPCSPEGVAGETGTIVSSDDAELDISKAESRSTSKQTLPQVPPTPDNNNVLTTKSRGTSSKDKIPISKEPESKIHNKSMIRKGSRVTHVWFCFWSDDPRT
ncbi:hypothetical protein F4776DRAFT_663024 [Hypoxylon sp. NC0597]|nr:hypothetical protein F4776DRAFT_663024 [Hypoxylon sp. NC0597]